MPISWGCPLIWFIGNWLIGTSCLVDEDCFIRWEISQFVFIKWIDDKALVFIEKGNKLDALKSVVITAQFCPPSFVSNIFFPVVKKPRFSLTK